MEQVRAQGMAAIAHALRDALCSTAVQYPKAFDAIQTDQGT